MNHPAMTVRQPSRRSPALPLPKAAAGWRWGLEASRCTAELRRACEAPPAPVRADRMPRLPPPPRAASGQGSGLAHRSAPRRSPRSGSRRPGSSRSGSSRSDAGRTPWPRARLPQRRRHGRHPSRHRAGESATPTSRSPHRPRALIRCDAPPPRRAMPRVAGSRPMFDAATPANASKLRRSCSPRPRRAAAGAASAAPPPRRSWPPDADVA